MATSTTELRQLLTEYRTLITRSRAAENSNLIIAGQLSELSSKLQVYSDEGFEDASRAIDDINSYIQLINQKVTASGENKTEQSTTVIDDANANTNKTAENKENSDGAAETANSKSNQGEASGTTPSSSSADGTTDMGEITVTAKRPSKDRPGKNPINPLSRFSSYTYGLSLYMVTPEALNNFILNNGSLSSLKGSGHGVYVVAQSGGVNTNSEDRLLTLNHKLGKGNPGLDYYIDDLKMTTYLQGGPEKASVSAAFKFSIIEPLSFTFQQDLSRASSALNAQSNLMTEAIAQGNEPNMFAQHYILGIRFYGYDVNGTLITGKSEEVMGYDNGGSNGNDAAVIQRYFAIKINSMKFKLNNKVVTYEIDASAISENISFGETNGIIKKNLTITGGTVAEALGAITAPNTRGLAQAINNDIGDQKDRDLIDIAAKIKIEFLDENGKVVSPKESVIGKSGLQKDVTAIPENAPISSSTPDKITIADSFKADSIDKNKKTISIIAGQRIYNAIDNIITHSNYISDALKETATQDVETKMIETPVTTTFKWFTVNPYVQIAGRDKKLKDWVYDITYQIKPYDVPYIRSRLPAKTSKYPGPYKKYSYYFTGTNSEVVKYEQQYDNLYYTVGSISTSTSKENDSNGQGNAPTSNQSSITGDNSSAGTNRGSVLNNEVRAQLYSPSDQTHGKITILGDPDYIMTSAGVKSAAGSKYYNKDGSISSEAGQVFIEMTFNMVVDYGMDPMTGESLDNGLLNVTDKLQFYRTDAPKKAGITGIVYMVTSVESTFSKGSFTQVLDCWMPPEEAILDASSSQSSGGSDAGGRMSDGGNESGSQSNGTTTTAEVTPVSSNSTAINANGVNNVPENTKVADTNASSTTSSAAISNEVRTETGKSNSTTAGATTTTTITPKATPQNDPEPPNNTTMPTQSGQVVVDDAVTWAGNSTEQYDGVRDA
jgi:hypothetical protein